MMVSLLWAFSGGLNVAVASIVESNRSIEKQNKNSEEAINQRNDILELLCETGTSVMGR